jgi:uncharacterized protein (DUF305 family)
LKILNIHNIAKSKKMARSAGRPKTPIDIQQLEKLAAVGCQESEMAWFFGMHPVSFSKRKTKKMQEAIDKGRNNGKTALRRKQFELAMAGDRTMLVWLGKQELGQSDKRHIEQEVTHHKSVVEMSDEELAQVISNDTTSDIARKQGRSGKRTAKQTTGT